MTGFHIKIQRHEKIYVVTMMLFFCLFYLLEHYNNRFYLNDFRVYYSAAQSFLHGQPVYDKAYGLSSGFYKYSPVALFFFAPVSLLPYWLAGTIHFFILGIAIIGSVIASTRIAQIFYPALLPRYMFFIPFLLTIIGITHIYRELHLGNINALLLALALLTLYLSLKRHDLAAGFLLALIILLKPHFLLPGLIYMLRSRFSLLGSSLVFLISGCFAPALFFGIGHNADLHLQWIHTMSVHNLTPETGSNTVYFALVQIIGQLGNFSPSRIFPYAVLTLILMLISMFVLRNKSLEIAMQQPVRRQGLIFEFILVTALIPGLTVTDTEHFMFSFPMIAFLVVHLFSVKGDYFRKTLIIMSFVLYGGNIYELVGRTLSDQMAAFGVLGTGNIVIIIIGYSIFNSYHRNTGTIDQPASHPAPGWIKAGYRGTTARLQRQPR